MFKRLEKFFFKRYIVLSCNPGRSSGHISILFFINTGGENNMTANTDDAVPRWCEAGAEDIIFTPCK